MLNYFVYFYDKIYTITKTLNLVIKELKFQLNIPPDRQIELLTMT